MTGSTMGPMRAMATMATTAAMGIGLGLALLGCKDPSAPPTAPPPPIPAPPSDAAVVGIDWSACDAALREAASLVDNRRVRAILDGCRPCGDWAPLLAWNTPQADGGPSRAQIEQSMLACGFCDPNAKQRFLGTLDDARGTPSRAPWRHLGDTCKERVSAVPDSRFMSPVFYALDRIARAAAAHPGSAALLAAIRLPLPAVSISSVGPELARSPVTTPAAGPFQITVLPTEIRIGRLPRATLGSAGVTVDFGGESYPGTVVTLAALPAAIATLVASDPTAQIAILAPHAMAAKPLVAVVRALPGRALVLAVASAEKLELAGWALPGTIPLALGPAAAKDALTLEVGASADAAIPRVTPANAEHTRIVVDDTTTVAVLAKLLGAITFKGGKRAELALATRPRRP